VTFFEIDIATIPKLLKLHNAKTFENDHNCTNMPLYMRQMASVQIFIILFIIVLIFFGVCPTFCPTLVKFYKNTGHVIHG